MPNQMYLVILGGGSQMWQGHGGLSRLIGAGQSRARAPITDPPITSKNHPQISSTQPPVVNDEEKSRNGDTLGPVELIGWSKQGDQGYQGDRGDQGDQGDWR